MVVLSGKSHLTVGKQNERSWIAPYAPRAPTGFQESDPSPILLKRRLRRGVLGGQGARPKEAPSYSRILEARERDPEGGVDPLG